MSSINRGPHALNREKTVAMPRKMIFVDTESFCEVQPNGDNFQHLRLGWACHYSRRYGRHRERTDWTYFETVSQFWTFVDKYAADNTKLWVIAHNINYDFTILQGWKYLKAMGYKLKFFYNGGVSCIISVRNKRRSIVFIDSMNWFPESLEKCGDRLGIPKINVDFDNCTDEMLSIHCKRDVEILLAVIKDFMEFLTSQRISRLCYTRASIAMACYLLNYYDHTIFIHNNQQAVDLERQSYRGGRTECFYIGHLTDGPYYTLDVNSLYPFVMLNNPYPTKYKQIKHQLSSFELGEYLKEYSCIANVLVETSERVYAVKRDRTVFPVGRFWVTLCTPELKYALANRHIREVSTTVIYEHAEIFTRFVERLYELRRRFKSVGNDSYQTLCKYILNSLYGKWGQKADIWKKIGVAPNETDRVEAVYDPVTNTKSQIRYLLGEVFELEGYEEGFNSFPGISSHVTAYGRMYLYNLMKVAGIGNYYYCDTDSLIVNPVGLENLKPHIDEIQIGALKLEDTLTNVNIRGLKDYTTDFKTVIKGVRKSATEISPGIFQQELWPSIKGMLRDVPSHGYTVKTITKTLSREYTKGTVLPSGWTSPFDFSVSD